MDHWDVGSIAIESIPFFTQLQAVPLGIIPPVDTNSLKSDSLCQNRPCFWLISTKSACVPLNRGSLLRNAYLRKQPPNDGHRVLMDYFMAQKMARRLNNGRNRHTILSHY